MTTLTDKELIKEIKERIGSLDVRDNIERRAYEIALASLEADPVAYIFKHPAGKLFWALTDESNKEQPDVIPVYADSPAPVVPDEIDVNDVPRAVTYFKTHRDCYADGWNACRAAMLQGSQPVSQTYKFPVNTPCQDAPAHIWLQTAGVWPEDGELSELTWCSHNQHHDDTLYVRADLVNSNSPVTPDGWISCSERMPDTKTAVLVAKEFDRKGDWRMKWATYIPGHPDANDGWIIPGASWKPSHWMPLPEPPQEVNRG
ncbi:DUF551 domain-containing protein [Salmonella enterica subsp. enterica serovar Enteritidis]|uniref:DUF551 domain-containing protein n=1 Tax=Salmonella TaxID=590 RepID=UPI0012809617|nr:DUF551 domain-containing protein [Salmonella enterica]MBJ4238749.1 DUF551 domain-containing protein [Salmonella enterica subsp. enterica serovar Rissen]MBJ5551288.1 DUF551 domain-containing protein [Salmonella enterica subsp. enterica serovar Derby]MCL8993758.1 DUF551 domain-containing protein [Salmonella enterica subsp. enterica serovar Enteritidis]MCV5957263.1 DUF551 domain-containing protein [Escherichia coli]EDB7677433.1 DUF551 domain-containing protein [Salmonella enterica]